MSEYDFIDHDYDVIVVGAGGSGLRATFGLSQSGRIERDQMWHANLIHLHQQQ